MFSKWFFDDDFNQVPNDPFKNFTYTYGIGIAATMDGAAIQVETFDENMRRVDVEEISINGNNILDVINTVELKNN